MRAPQAVKGSARIYLEAYTSILMVDKERLVRPAESRQLELDRVSADLLWRPWANRYRS